MRQKKTQPLKPPPDTGSPLSPAEQIYNLLSDDMKATNDLIIKRLDSEVVLIPHIAAYIIASGGKRLRPLLALACARLFDPCLQKAHLLAAAVEFIHTATLLHDDVVDESDKRRGKESSHRLFGNHATILVGDYLFAKAFELMVETEQIQVLDILSKASAIITEGEVRQLALVRRLDTGIEDYFRVVEGKTSALFAAACSAGGCVAGAGKEEIEQLYSYGMQLGTAFQISDDVLDYAGSEYNTGKNCGDDFREGKMTLPLIFALQDSNGAEQDFWTEILSSDHTPDEKDFNRAIEIIKKYRSLERSLEVGYQYAQRACEALGTFQESELKTLLEDMAVYCVHRPN